MLKINIDLKIMRYSSSTIFIYFKIHRSILKCNISEHGIRLNTYKNHWRGTDSWTSIIKAVK